MAYYDWIRKEDFRGSISVENWEAKERETKACKEQVLILTVVVD